MRTDPLLAVILLCASILPAVAAEPEADPLKSQNAEGKSGSYHLTFDEEFNQFNASRWQTCDFWEMRNNPGDFQAQWFADSTSVSEDGTKVGHHPFSVENGVLKIIAQPTPAQVYSGPQNLPFVSGQLTSAHKFTQRYGYFELRAKVPAGKGLWSRFWLLTDDGIWPGEYDVFEILGKEKNDIHQNTHYRTATQPHGVEGGTYKAINPYDGEFHTYGFLWEKTGVTWYVDGVATLTKSNRVDIPMYVLIDLAVGKDPGNLWPGEPEATATWPARMELDYYRVYSNDPSLASVTPDAGYSPSRLQEGRVVESTSLTHALPAGWTAGDLGTPSVSGSSSWNQLTDEWMVKGTASSSQSQFASCPFPGDGVVTATLQNVTNINQHVIRAGIAIRAGRDEKAREISLVYRVTYQGPKLDREVVLQESADGRITDLAVVPGKVEVPVAFRLERKGQLCTASCSTDGGRTWITVGSPQALGMSGPVCAGLLVGGYQAKPLRLARAIFSEVTVTHPEAPARLP
jgi:beta-glucanase (GH16 family)